MAWIPMRELGLTLRRSRPELSGKTLWPTPEVVEEDGTLRPMTAEDGVCVRLQEMLR